MEIIVRGMGELKYKPNQISLSYTFNAKGQNYEEALSNGVEMVDKYVGLLKMMQFNADDFKTQSLKVSEAKKYDEELKKYVPDGYTFNQQAVLKFDYNMEQLTSLMSKTSKISNPPAYRINFTIKDNKDIEAKLIKKAIEDAEFQARVIAEANGKELKECLKTSFEPFDKSADYSSNTKYECAMAKCSADVGEKMLNTFIPDDVSVETEIYCLYLAE